MQIKFTLPAVAIDNDGNEQEIEINFHSEVNPYKKEGVLAGDIDLLDAQASFRFVPRHPFTTAS